MAKLSSFPPNTLVLVVAAFLSGGLAGAVFNWYMNKPQLTTITYSVTTTPFAPTEATTLIPNLKIQVGNEKIMALYAHTIEFQIRRGPHADRADVAITFPRKIRIYGLSAESPSRVHSASCTRFPDGVQCTMSPIEPTTPRYRVALATDAKEAPAVVMVAKNVELLKTDEFLTGQTWWLHYLTTQEGLVNVLLVSLLVFLMSFQLTMVRRVIRRRADIVIVGKVLDADQRPVAGAQVEVQLDSPAATFQPAQTDRSGDFIAGHLSKIALLSGRMRITHPDYMTIERQIESPIVVQTLQRSH